MMVVLNSKVLKQHVLILVSVKYLRVKMELNKVKTQRRAITPDREKWGRVNSSANSFAENDATSTSWILE